MAKTEKKANRILALIPIYFIERRIITQGGLDM